MQGKPVGLDIDSDLPFQFDLDFQSIDSVKFGLIQSDLIHFESVKFWHIFCDVFCIT